MKARYVQKGDVIDYKPSAAVAAGDVVVIGRMVGVARLDIEADTLGTLAIAGTFDVEKDANAISAGAAVYWNSADLKATANASGNTFMGVAVADAEADAGAVRVTLKGVDTDTVYAPSAASAIADAESTVSGYTTINAILAALRTNGIVTAGA